jgi:tRNA(Ile)-lysidine synthase TilS/MesJ
LAAPSIATGHTASDNLETIVLNLTRAATVEGLGGIRPHRVLDCGTQVVRPLWKATRAQTEAACREADWDWRTDSSNSSTHPRRNRVRHEVVPLLCSLDGRNPETLARQFARGAALWRDDIQFLNELATETLGQLVVKSGHKLLVLDGLRFGELPRGFAAPRIKGCSSATDGA